jgi:hypothetical protein
MRHLHCLFKWGEMLLVRPVIASSVNHVRAFFSPHATLVKTLYTSAMDAIPLVGMASGST